MDTETQTRRGWTPCEVRMEAETGDTAPECQELRATADARDEWTGLCPTAFKGGVTLLTPDFRHPASRIVGE